MVEPNQELLADERVPRVTLAGREWPVPKLTIEQNVYVWPILIKRFKDMGSLDNGAMTTEALQDYSTALFWCLQRGHKALTRAEFNSLEIDLSEIIAAIPIIGRQSGLLKPLSKESGVPAPDPLSLTDGERPSGTSIGTH